MILLKRELYDEVLHFQLAVTVAAVTLAALSRGKAGVGGGIGSAAEEHGQGSYAL
jgi:hypothetical protein